MITSVCERHNYSGTESCPECKAEAERRGLKAVMHLDGCHFFIWVHEIDGKQWLTFYDRQGDDLKLHRRSREEGEEPCEGCTALSKGREPRMVKREISLPDDPKESLVACLLAIAEIDEPESSDL